MNSKFAAIAGGIAVIVGVSVIVATFYNPLLGQQEPTFIKDVEQTNMKNFTSFVTFSYCNVAEGVTHVGVVARSDVEVYPMPISENLEVGKCEKRVAKIHYDNETSVSLSPFAQEDIPGLLNEMEKQVKNSRNAVAKLNKEIIVLQMTDSENTQKIRKAEMRKALFEEINQASKEGLKTLYGLRIT